AAAPSDCKRSLGCCFLILSLNPDFGADATGVESIGGSSFVVIQCLKDLLGASRFGDNEITSRRCMSLTLRWFYDEYNTALRAVLFESRSEVLSFGFRQSIAY